MAPLSHCQPGNELVVLLFAAAAARGAIVAARGAGVPRVRDERGHVEKLGEMNPCRDLLMQPTGVLEPKPASNCGVSGSVVFCQSKEVEQGSYSVHKPHQAEFLYEYHYR